MLNLIFPKICYVCEKEDEYLCTDCFKKVIKIDPINRCHYCNKESRIGFVHKECSVYSYLEGILNLTLYDGLIKKLIYDIKYNYHFAVVETLGKVMADYFKFYNFNSSNSILTFVPTSAKKFRIRGFNQSELLTKQVAKFSQIEFITIIEKTKNTGAQAKLGKSGRAENLRDAFHLNQKFKISNPGVQNIIIIDDVFTTGATLNECAKIIKQAFPQIKVFGYVIAKARS